MWGAFFTGHLWHFIGLILLLIGSGFFSGSETSLFSLSRGQVHRLRQVGRAGAMVASLMRRPRRTLNTLLLGNMLVNVAFAAISAALVYELRHAGAASWTVVIASVAPLLALILFGEIAPKVVAFSLRRNWALLAGGVVKVISLVLSPPLWLLDHVLISPLTRMMAPAAQGGQDVTAEELASLLELSAKRGVLDYGINELLQKILDLPELRASEVMVPRVDLVAYDVDDPPAGLAELFRRTKWRRVPVYEGDLDHVVGVIHYKRALLGEPQSLRELVTKVPFVPEAANLEQLLMRFRATASQTAIVVDEYGGTAGLITLQDVLEEIVGDIPDQYDRITVEPGPPVEPIGKNRYVVDGQLPIHEWMEAFPTDISDRRVSTIGGFVTSLLGRIARPGDVATYRNLRFVVETMRERRIGKLRIELLGEGDSR